ncbi:MAG: aminotransferase class V-fold PLP-dependent enzyme [Acidimicrobiales bacterium]
MSLDIETIRAETPGCSSVIHLNNAGSSLPPAVVVDAVVDYLQAEARIGGYEIASDRAEALESVYTNASALLGGQPRNWAFVESATRAWNAAFSSLRFRPGDRVLTTKAEYPSNMGGLLRAHEIQGVDVVVVPDDEDGQVDVEALESMLDDRTRLVSLTHVPTQGGLINPATRVGEILRGTPILYQVDACQSVGQLHVRVEEIGCDILSFTGRKFLRGPRGTGMVWANDAALAQMGNPAGVDMQGAFWDAPMSITPLESARRFEPYEVFFAGKVGLAVALEYAASIGMDAVVARNRELSTRLRSGLSEVPGVTVQDKGVDRSAIVTFTVEGWNAREVQLSLRRQGINVSTSSEGSARLDFPDRGLHQIVRSSVHYFNTADEVDALVSAIDAMGPGVWLDN